MARKNDRMAGMIVVFPDEKIEAAAREGDTLLDVIRQAGLSIEANCSGQGTCGKCMVRVNGEKALACMTAAEDGQRVEILRADEDHVILTESLTKSDFSAAREPVTTEPVTEEPGTAEPGTAEPVTAEPANAGGEMGKRSRIAFAIDIGTTTVVIKAVDTISGEEAGLRAFANPQRVYGADVLSRINNAMDDASLLSGVITEAIDGAIGDILKNEAAGAGPEKVVIAGNTTMIYLLLNRRCRSLGLVPFEPEYATDPVYEYREVFGKNTLGCPVLIYPYISAFVGGDIVSGLVNIERHLEKGTEPSYMLIDMGTNGELAFRCGGRLLTTSTAAGPALEGGNISCGMSGLPGAVYAVAYEGGGRFSCQTIGDRPVLGICGSGVISLMAALLDAGLVSETGAFTEEADSIAETGEAIPGNKQLVIAEPGGGHSGGERLVFTQKDVREVQLAKGAIRAGLDILTEEMGEKPGMIYLAGGFGQNIDLRSAFRTGLIPRGREGRILVVGNTSLGGCVDACTEGTATGPLPSLDIIAAAEEINLGAHGRFNDKFMETMMFD